jgi:glycosyltransferase involved in cell wall biosynthesis
MKKISILLAVNNGELYLDETLKSVCSQTFTEWELIAVENGSTDQTLSILNSWACRDQRIKVFINDLKGKNKAFNTAFNESTADFICFLGADDILHPESLGRRFQILDKDNNMNFSTCLLETISEIDKFRGIIFPKNRDSPNFSGGSIFFKRKIANKIFPIPEILPNEDVWTSLHLKNFGKGVHLPEPLYYYRIHSNNSYGYQATFTEKRKGFLKRMIAFDLFLDKYKYELSKDKVDYLNAFTRGRLLAEKRKVIEIILLKLPIKDKIIFYYFCSPFLFRLKNRLFKYLSGNLELF